MVFLGRRPGDGDGASANEGYVALFRSARACVRALTPNLNDGRVRRVLAAATAHADVRLLLSKGFNDLAEAMPLQGGTNVANAAWLKRHAVDPARVHVRWFSREVGVPVEGNGIGASHAKWASADGEVMILGSQNLDTQSFHRSRESNIAIDDASVTGEFDAIFDGLWETAASDA
jgi:phosphatidylserine/phosphatidylglycerophosphate/cardiolipin synthase-like enzyme